MTWFRVRRTQGLSWFPHSRSAASGVHARPLRARAVGTSGPTGRDRRRNSKEGRPTRGATMSRYVYDFVEGNKDLKDLLGGKGANLAEMTRMGLPVPPGFTITTEACRAYLATGDAPAGLFAEVGEHLHELETRMGRNLGDPDDPLLVSVRSGAKFSMPGMMETVLDIGLSDASVAGLCAHTDDPRFAWDSYRRLIQMFGRTVFEVPAAEFEAALESAKQVKGVASDTDLDEPDLRHLVEVYKKVFHTHTGRDFPQAPHEQLHLAIRAVFRSWNAERAVVY